MTPLSLGFVSASEIQLCASSYIFGCGACRFYLHILYRPVSCLRPEWSVLSQTKFQGWFAGDWALCFLSEVLPPEVDWLSTDIFICFCVVIVPARFLLTSAILCHAVSNKLAFGEFIRPRMISLTLGTHIQTLDFCCRPCLLFGGVYKLPVGFHVVYA